CGLTQLRDKGSTRLGSRWIRLPLTYTASASVTWLISNPMGRSAFACCQVNRYHTTPSCRGQRCDQSSGNVTGTQPVTGGAVAFQSDGAASALRRVSAGVGAGAANTQPETSSNSHAARLARGIGVTATAHAPALRTPQPRANPPRACGKSAWCNLRW